MREWETDGSIEADTRYSPLVRSAFRSRWIPMWLLNALTRLCR